MKTGRIFVILISLTIVAWLTWPGLVDAEGPQGRIEGIITNLTTGGPPQEPLPSVEIVVNGWMVLRSGRDGEWNVTGLKPGEYTVELRLPPDYSPAQEVLTTTIWGDNTEIVNLVFYEGQTQPAGVTAAMTVSSTAAAGRVESLGVTPTPTPPFADRVQALSAAATPVPPPAVTPTAVMTDGAAITTSMVLPGQGGFDPPGYDWRLSFWLGVGIAVSIWFGVGWKKKGSAK